MSTPKTNAEVVSGRSRTEVNATKDSIAAIATSMATTGAGVRVLLYSHDTFGLGHLQRCLKISRALMAQFHQMAILIATGSPVVHRFELPAGVDYVKLPAVRKIGPEEYEARILATSYEQIIATRTQILNSLAQTFCPHILLVDHSPTGMKGEMLPALRWLQEHDADCVKIIGLRDIIDDPTTTHEHWKQSGIYDVLDTLYDYVLIYGSQSTYDTAHEYGFPESVRAKTTFCNYIGDASSAAKARKSTRRARKRHQVVVTIGGGDGGGELVIGTFLEMLNKYRDEVNFDSLILTGPFLPEDLAQRFQALAKGLPVVIKKFVSSTTPYFRRADLVVATAGYNSITQILEFAKRALIIPRILHRQEQEIRARRLDELGIVTMLHPQNVDADAVYRQVRMLLSDHREPIAEARAHKTVKLDGVDRITDIFAGILANLAMNEDHHE